MWTSVLLALVILQVGVEEVVSTPDDHDILPDIAKQDENKDGLPEAHQRQSEEPVSAVVSTDQGQLGDSESTLLRVLVKDNLQNSTEPADEKEEVQSTHSRKKRTSKKGGKGGGGGCCGGGGGGYKHGK